MQHVAVDLGSVQSQICIRNSQGEILKEVRVRTAQLPRSLKRQQTSRVILETTAEAFFVVLGRVAGSRSHPLLSLQRGIGAQRNGRGRRHPASATDTATPTDECSVSCSGHIEPSTPGN